MHADRWARAPCPAAAYCKHRVQHTGAGERRQTSPRSMQKKNRRVHLRREEGAMGDHCRTVTGQRAASPLIICWALLGRPPVCSKNNPPLGECTNVASKARPGVRAARNLNQLPRGSVARRCPQTHRPPAGALPRASIVLVGVKAAPPPCGA